MSENGGGDWNRAPTMATHGMPEPHNGRSGPNKMLNSQSAAIIFLNVLNTVTHIFIGGVSFVTFTFVRLGSFSDTFNQHVILCTFGYFVLMSQAILTFDPRNGWSNGLLFRQRKISHWIIQIAASALAIAGSVIRIGGVGGNFATPHSVLGLIALVLTCLSLLGGLINLFSSELRIPGRFIKICHSLVGVGAYVCGVVSLILGFDKTQFRFIFDDITTSSVIGATAVAMIGTILSSFAGVFKRIKG